MHLVVNGALEAALYQLVDREGIHVSTERDDRLAPADRGNDARLGVRVRVFDAHLVEVGPDPGRSVVLLEHELGISMELAAGRDHPLVNALGLGAEVIQGEQGVRRAQRQGAHKD